MTKIQGKKDGHRDRPISISEYTEYLNFITPIYVFELLQLYGVKVVKSRNKQRSHKTNN